jgi:UDP-2,4-diacetamido-2,4,6-trideoxy-beta-L-altropyranose hydrolase
MIEQELKSAKTIVLRADSSDLIGSGHIMRCLTLADILKKKGTTVIFICRLLLGNIAHLVEKKGYRVHQINSNDNGESYDKIANAEKTISLLQNMMRPVDWIVVDHYDLDKKWEVLVRPYVRKIMVIDDLANRCHDCDLLLDQNLYTDMDVRYDKLTPSYCKKILGPRYALLRSEFLEARKKLKYRDGSVKRVLVLIILSGD